MRYLACLTHVVCLSALIVLSCGRPAAADLVGWWDFNDESADDRTANGNDGEVVNLDFSDDVPDATTGKSLDVFGGGSVVVPHSDSLDIADTLTVAFWMKANLEDQGTANWNGPMSKSAGDPRIGWEMQRWEDQSRIDIRVDTDEADNSVRGNLVGTYDEEWVHVAWTLEEGEWASFLDGELVEFGSYPHGDGFANEDADLLFGCRGNNWCAYVGLLDEIGIWDNVLSEAEIESLAMGIPPIGGGPDPGDYNTDGMLDVLDLNLQADAMMDANPDLGLYDHNDDGMVDYGDRRIWVEDLKMTAVGDANLNGSFGTGDLVDIFQAGKFETGNPANWSEGDFNGDKVFGTGDLVAAFQAGDFDPNAAVSAVPEPSGLTLLLLGILPFLRRRS